MRQKRVSCRLFVTSRCTRAYKEILDGSTIHKGTTRGSKQGEDYYSMLDKKRQEIRACTEEFIGKNEGEIKRIRQAAIDD